MRREIYQKLFPNLMIYLLLLFAFLPPLIYLAWIRKTERIEAESWFPLILTFLWGSSVSVIVALILETFISASLIDLFKSLTAFSFFLGVIVAPIVEEFAKPTILSLGTVRRNINELEDGLIYGAAAGLGFSATEDLLYGLRFLDKGWIFLIALFYTRTIGCCLLHASATALTGYGYSKSLIKGEKFTRILPYFGTAVLAHSIYNLFAFSSIIFHQIVGTVTAILFSVSMIIWVRKEIMVLDRYEAENSLN